MMIDVSTADLASALTAVIPHASTDKTLPMLRTVRLRVVGMNLQAAATDRYTAGVYRVSASSDDDAVPHPFEALVDLDDAKRLLVAAKSVKVDVSTRLDVSDGWLTVTLPGSVLRLQLVDASFPKLEQIITGVIEAAKSNLESQGTGESRGYNPAFLAKFGKAGDKYAQMVIWPSRAGKPTLVTVGRDFIGIICILRGEYSISSWLDDSSVPPVEVAA